MRRRHRCPAQRTVDAPRQGAEDVHARRRQVDRVRSVVREPRLVVIAVRGRHRDDVRQVVAGREERLKVGVDAFVPGRRDEDHPGISGGADSVHQRLREIVAPPGVVQNVDTQAGGVVDRGDGGGGGAVASGVEEFQRDQRHAPGDAGDADGVVSDGADRSRDVRTVPEVIHRIVVVVVEVPAVHVVQEAVLVIVDAVAGDLARVGPDVGRQVGMRVVDAAVDDADDDRTIAGGDRPGGLGRDVGPGKTARLTAVVQSPQERVALVVRRQHGVQDIVRLGVFDMRVAAQPGDGLLGAQPRGQLPVLRVASELVYLLRAQTGPDRVLVRLPGARLELDQGLAGEKPIPQGLRFRRGRSLGSASLP